MPFRDSCSWLPAQIWDLHELGQVGSRPRVGEQGAWRCFPDLWSPLPGLPASLPTSEALLSTHNIL